MGPEGGFHQEEINQAEGKGFIPISLGPRILRSETAALALICLLQFLWGDMGSKKRRRRCAVLIVVIITFDYLDRCGKCRTDLTGERHTLNLLEVAPTRFLCRN